MWGSNHHASARKQNTLTTMPPTHVDDENDENLVNDIRKIIGLFDSSTVLLDELLKLQSLRPIQDVSTRWNSVYKMIERFVLQVEHIKIILNQSQNKKYEKHIYLFIMTLTTRMNSTKVGR